VYPTISISVIAALGFALAGGTAPGADAAPAVDPCSLLTTAQVSSAIGGAAQPGQPINKTGCSWSSTSPKAMVTISFDNLGTYASMKAGHSPVVSKTSVSGVGEDAYYSTMGPTTTLTVKKGDTYFVVRVYGFPDPAKQKEIEKTLGAQAAAKM
jgi:hypothetical protein